MLVKDLEIKSQAHILKKILFLIFIKIAENKFVLELLLCGKNFVLENVNLSETFNQSRSGGVTDMQTKKVWIERDREGIGITNRRSGSSMNHFWQEFVSFLPNLVRSFIHCQKFHPL